MPLFFLREKTYLPFRTRPLRGAFPPPSSILREKETQALTYSLFILLSSLCPAPHHAPGPGLAPPINPVWDLARLPIGSLSIVYRPGQTAHYVRRGRSGPLFWLWLGVLWFSTAISCFVVFSRRVSCFCLSWNWCVDGDGVVVDVDVGVITLGWCALPTLLPLPCRDATQRRMLRMFVLLLG